MSIRAEYRKMRASRIALGRGPLWWLDMSPVPTGWSWTSRRLTDIRVALTVLFVCGVVGHRWGTMPAVPELGWPEYVSCSRCGEFR